MKNGKKLALALGLAAGAVLAVVASKSSKKVKQHMAKSVPADKSLNAEMDDSEVYYI